MKLFSWYTFLCLWSVSRLMSCQRGREGEGRGAGDDDIRDSGPSRAQGLPVSPSSSGTSEFREKV